MTETTTSTTPRTAGSGEPILKLRAVNKSFGPVHVLQDVDFEARAGEVTALVGDNGAGKSTLVKCIGGTYSIDSGDYLFEGAPVRVHDPRDAAALGIEIVYQDLALCENLDIVANMFLGRERVSGWKTLDENTMERMAGETLSGLSVRTVKSLRQQVSSLSGGQRQTVAIAKSVLWNSKVVILDEPTAALGVAQTAQVLELVRRLADRGLAVILISHNMRDVLEVADRIVALYLGRTAAQVNRADVTQTQVVELITAGHSGNLGLVPGTNGNGGNGGNGDAGNVAQMVDALGIADQTDIAIDIDIDIDIAGAGAGETVTADAVGDATETDGTDGVQGAAE